MLANRHQGVGLAGGKAIVSLLVDRGTLATDGLDGGEDDSTRLGRQLGDQAEHAVVFPARPDAAASGVGVGAVGTVCLSCPPVLEHPARERPGRGLSGELDPHVLVGPGRHAGHRPRLVERDLAGTEHLGQFGQPLHGVADAQELASGAQVEPGPHRQEVGAGAITTGSPVAFRVEVRSHLGQLGERRLNVRGELGKLVAEGLGFVLKHSCNRTKHLFVSQGKQAPIYTHGQPRLRTPDVAPIKTPADRPWHRGCDLAGGSSLGHKYAGAASLTPSQSDVRPQIMEQAIQESNGVRPPPRAPSAAPGPRAAGPSRARPLREVFGYVNAGNLGDPTVGYPSWNFSLLSTVPYFGLSVDAGGNLIQGNISWNVWNSTTVTGLISTAHSRGTRVVISQIQHDSWYCSDL